MAALGVFAMALFAMDAYLLSAITDHSRDMHGEPGPIQFYAEKFIWIRSSLVILLVACSFWLLWARIFAPISRLTKALNRVRSGDRAAEIPFLNRPDEIGELARSVADLRDSITEVERARHDQVRSDRKYAAILEIAHDGVIVVGSDHCIQLFNQGAERIFGYSRTEALGRTIDFLLPEQFRDSHDAQMRSFTEGTEQARAMSARSDIWGRRKDGSVFPAEASISKIDIGSEQLMTVVMRDISVRRRLEAERQIAQQVAEAANKSKTDFLANMSHELRTPLNAIIGFSDILKEQRFGALSADKVKDYAGDVNEAGKHLLQIINDLLDVSRLEVGRIELHESPVDLYEIVKACHIILDSNARSKPLPVVYDLPENLPRLQADPVRLKQIIINLMTNALKFTKSSGSVRLAVEVTDRNEVVIKVRDEGVGVAEKDIPKVLSRFGQVATSYARESHEQGAGLGLTIVQLLCELHSAKFEFTSKVGVGTTVTITFPASRSVAAEDISDLEFI